MYSKGNQKVPLTIREAHIDISVVPVFVTLNLQFPPGRLNDSQEPAAMENDSSLRCRQISQSPINYGICNTHSLANPLARVWQSSMVGATLSAMMQEPSAIDNNMSVLKSFPR